MRADQPVVSAASWMVSASTRQPYQGCVKVPSRQGSSCGPCGSTRRGGPSRGRSRRGRGGFLVLAARAEPFLGDAVGKRLDELAQRLEVALLVAADRPGQRRRGAVPRRRGQALERLVGGDLAGLGGDLVLHL